MGVLHARLDRSAGDRMVIKQEGGHGPHVRSVMCAVHQDMMWSAKDQAWVCPYLPASVFALTEAAQFLGLQLALDATLTKVRAAVVAKNEKEEQIRKVIQRYIDDAKLPLAEYTTQQSPPPWRHQQLAYHWSVRVDAMYLQHKMGLGKTREGADIIQGKAELGFAVKPVQWYASEAPSAIDPSRMLQPQWCTKGGILVVAPRAAMIEWVEQLWRWQGMEALPIVGSAEQKKYRAGIDAWVHVCSYDSLETVERNCYDGIVADELHFAANDDSNRHKRLMALRSTAKWVVGLSGTAMTNGIESLFAQYFFLDFGRTLGTTIQAFRKKFTSKEAKEAGGGTPEEKVSRAISRITWPLSMQEAFPDKPIKIHKTIRVPMTAEQANYYEKVRSSAEADFLTGKVSVIDGLTRVNKLLQISQGFVFDNQKQVQSFSSAKLKVLEEMLKPKGELHDKRTIVWCSFIPEMKMLEDMLQRVGIKYLALKGGINEAQKGALKEAWNNDASYRVLLGMVQMGIGLNLHAPKCIDDDGKPARCSTTVFYGLTWKMVQVEQAMDRVYRGDQVESCLYLYLLSEDLDSGDDTGNGGKKKPVIPVDVRVYESLMGKIEKAKEVNVNSIAYVRSLLAAA